MCEEKLEKIIAKETKKIEDKYEESKRLLNIYPSYEVKKTTGIDFEVVKLMRIRRKRLNEINELKREVYELEYEINYKMGFEIGLMEAKYEMANEMLKNNVPVRTIAKAIELTEEQVKQLL